MGRDKREENLSLLGDGKYRAMPPLECDLKVGDTRWGMPTKRCDLRQLTCELAQGTQRLPTPSLSLECGFGWPFLIPEAVPRSQP